MVRKMVTRLAFVIGVCNVHPAAAQMDLLGPGAGFLSVGTSRISTAELDDWLGQRDYPTFGRTARSIGLGGYRIVSSSVLLGFEAQGFIIGEGTHADREVGLGAGYATLGIGYVVNVSPRARVYPRFGFGAGGIALWTEQENRLDFEDVLEERTALPDRDTNLSRDGMVLDFGAGAEFVPRRSRGLLIGLRAGYLTGPFTSTWETYGHAVSGGPEASINGPYLRALIGWSWTR